MADDEDRSPLAARRALVGDALQTLQALDLVFHLPALRLLDESQLASSAHRALEDEEADELDAAETLLNELDRDRELVGWRRVTNWHDKKENRARHHAKVPHDDELKLLLETREVHAGQKVRPPRSDDAPTYKVRLKHARGEVWHEPASRDLYEAQYASGTPPWVPPLELTAAEAALLSGHDERARADGNIRNSLKHNQGFLQFMKVKMELKAKAKQAKHEASLGVRLGKHLDAYVEESTQRMDMARRRRQEEEAARAKAELPNNAAGFLGMLRAAGKLKKKAALAQARKAAQVPFYEAYRPGRRLTDSVAVRVGSDDASGDSAYGPSAGRNLCANQPLVWDVPTKL